MLITRGFSWLEPQIVVLNVAGSSPVFHPGLLVMGWTLKNSLVGFMKRNRYCLLSDR